MVMEVVLYALLLITAIPIGRLLSWICEEEMVLGKKWFKVILGVLIVGFGVSLVFYREIAVLMTLGYMIIVTLVSLLYKKK